MMNILWRYQIREFSVRLLFILTFTTLALLTLKSDMFAKLVAIGISAKTLVLFLMLQIPLLLPMAISISCFLSVCLVVHKLWRSNMLSTLRACGLSIQEILAPLYFMGLFFSFINLLLLSDLVPLARMQSYALLHDETKINPLVTLKKGKAPLLRHSFVHMEMDKSKKFAKNLFLLIPDPHTEFLHLLTAKSISYDESVSIKESSLISTIAQEDGKMPTLVIENVFSQKIPLSFFLPSPTLYYSAKNYGVLTFKELFNSFNTYKNPFFLSDIFVRLGFIILPFSLTFTGAIFSLRSLESKQKVRIALLAISCVVSIVGIIAARTFRVSPNVAILASIVPSAIFIPLAAIYRSFLERGKV